MFQASSDIDRIAGHHVLIGRGHHLAGVDADADGEGHAVLRLELGIQFG